MSQIAIKKITGRDNDRKTAKRKITKKVKEFEQILSRNTFEHSKLDSLLVDLYPFKNDKDFKAELNRLREKYDVIRTNCTMQGRAFKKEYGYAGDFEIIDKIYTNHVSINKKYAPWDKYFHKQPAPIAVRNRKKYFKEKFKGLYSNERIEVLNLASGPCRDIYELFTYDDKMNIHFDCLELDKNAIQFGKKLILKYQDRVKFINQNIFRFIPNQKYDIIWSAGLFDYFDDKTFVQILKRLIQSNRESKIIIGNFSDENPTMPYMEIIGEWFLNYRSSDKLIELAILAGASKNKITIEKEPENVNLFLNIN